MPQIGKMKFPYTKAGKDRYQAIKKQLGGAKQAATMYPTNPPRPVRPGKPGRPGKGPVGIRVPGMYRPGRPKQTRPINIPPRPVGRPKPPNRKYL